MVNMRAKGLAWSNSSVGFVEFSLLDVELICQVSIECGSVLTAKVGLQSRDPAQI